MKKHNPRPGSNGARAKAIKITPKKGGTKPKTPAGTKGNESRLREIKRSVTGL